MSDASVASECLPDDRGEFNEAGKSVWCFLLFARSSQRPIDGCLGLCVGTSFVL